jgi:hypothetical protein
MRKQLIMTLVLCASLLPWTAVTAQQDDPAEMPTQTLTLDGEAIAALFDENFGVGVVEELTVTLGEGEMTVNGNIVAPDEEVTAFAQVFGVAVQDGRLVFASPETFAASEADENNTGPAFRDDPEDEAAVAADATEVPADATEVPDAEATEVPAEQDDQEEQDDDARNDRDDDDDVDDRQRSEDDDTLPDAEATEAAPSEDGSSDEDADTTEENTNEGPLVGNRSTEDRIAFQVGERALGRRLTRLITQQVRQANENRGAIIITAATLTEEGLIIEFTNRNRGRGGNSGN